MSGLFVVTRTLGERTYHLRGHPWDGFCKRWEWSCYSSNTPDLWLTSEQLEALRSDSWYGTNVEAHEVSNGPWSDYWHPEGDRLWHLYTARKIVEWSFKGTPVGPFTLTVTNPDDPDAWWAWHTPRDVVKPGLVFKSKLLLGVAGGSVSSLEWTEKVGRGRILAVKAETVTA